MQAAMVARARSIRCGKPERERSNKEEKRRGWQGAPQLKQEAKRGLRKSGGTW